MHSSRKPIIGPPPTPVHSTTNAVGGKPPKRDAIEKVNELSKAWWLYTVADFVISDEEIGLMDLTDRQLQKAIRPIAIIEAPISVDEIGRRLLSLLGKGFLYLPEQEVFPVRNRRSTEISQLRKLENIAPEEIRSALIQVIAEGIGTEASETVASATRLLGISNSQAVQESLLKTLASLKSKSQVRDRDGKLFIVA